MIFSHGIEGFWGVGLRGWGGQPSPFFSPPFLSTHPEQTGPDPYPGLNPFHQSDLREKHSSIPEKRSHIYRSSGNRRKLMKCRLTVRREGRAAVWNLRDCQTKSQRRQRRRQTALRTGMFFQSNSNSCLRCAAFFVLFFSSAVFKALQKKYNWLSPFNCKCESQWNEGLR